MTTSWHTCRRIVRDTQSFGYRNRHYHGNNHNAPSHLTTCRFYPSFAYCSMGIFSVETESASGTKDPKIASQCHVVTLVEGLVLSCVETPIRLHHLGWFTAQPGLSSAQQTAAFGGLQVFLAVHYPGPSTNTASRGIPENRVMHGLEDEYLGKKTILKLASRW